jgi:hypothetical protein
METPTISHELASQLALLPSAVDRLTKALMGDDAIGHDGLVSRMTVLEAIAQNIHVVHGEIDQRRIDGDRRVHERVDALDKRIRAELEALRENSRRWERKLDRVIWMVSGAAFAAGGGMAFLVQQLLGLGQ